MGIIQQQTIKGSFYSYLGILIGAISLIYFQPRALQPQEIGLISVLAPFSQLFAQFSILGFNGTARYFPFFRNEEKNHHGFLFLACLVASIGFLLFLVLSILLKDEFINHNTEHADLLQRYYWYIIPLTFFTLFFNVFDLYARMLYDSTSGRILQEFGKRVLILITVFLIFFNTISFEVFMPLWLIANLLPTFQLGLKLYRRNQFNLQPDLKSISSDLKSKLINVSGFTILTGSAPLIIENVDKFMITAKFGLSDTGVYTVAFYFGAIIALPARSLYSIAYTIIADSWKTNDLKNIKMIYEKSCLNQLIAAIFIFIAVWANIDGIMEIVPPEYEEGKYVIFFIGLAYVIDSATGANGVLLATSKYYKYDSLFHFSLIAVTIIANLFFIPRYGITGAAMATACTLFIFNFIRYLFIWFAFKLQPFSFRNPLVIVIAVTIYGLSILLPETNNYIIDFFVRSFLITISYWLCIYYIKLSEDINSTVDKFLISLKRIKNR